MYTITINWPEDYNVNQLDSVLVHGTWVMILQIVAVIDVKLSMTVDFRIYSILIIKQFKSSRYNKTIQKI